MTPLDKLEGRQPQIFAGRDRKLEEARRQEVLLNLLPKPLVITGEAPVAD